MNTPTTHYWAYIQVPTTSFFPHETKLDIEFRKCLTQTQVHRTHSLVNSWYSFTFQTFALKPQSVELSGIYAIFMILSL